MRKIVDFRLAIADYIGVVSDFDVFRNWKLAIANWK